MLRYLLISTCIVLTLVVIATAWAHRDLIRIVIAPTSLPDAPKRGTLGTTAPGADGALTGAAPWALSALPDCLTQTAVSHGPLAYVRAHLPADATIVADGTALAYGPCTILVRGDEVDVRRGPDRLVVPAHVTLYRTHQGLALLRVDDGSAELRTYEPAHLPHE